MRITYFVAGSAMKAFIAACTAVGVLWGVDLEFNKGRYSDVVKQAVKSVMAR